MNKIYQGKLKNQGSESFRLSAKGYKKVLGAFCSGGAMLSLTFDNGKEVLLRNFEFQAAMDTPPNKRPFIFEKPVQMEIISGVICNELRIPASNNVSVYLIMEEE